MHPDERHIVMSAEDDTDLAVLLPAPSKSHFHARNGASVYDTPLLYVPRSLSAVPSANRTLHPYPEDNKTITYWQGICLIISRQIGSGIFSVPALVNRNAGSVGMSLLIWFAAGCIAYAGALSYAELGCAIPLNGGAYVYLQHLYGSVTACLFSWTMIFILKPVGAAVVAIIFGQYFVRIITLSFNQDDTTPVWAQKAGAILCLWTVIAINVVGSRWGPAVNSVFTVIKICAVGSIAVIGIALLATGHGQGNLSHNWFDRYDDISGNIALALFSGLWSYNGWDNVNFVSAEMRNPARNIPRVIHTALPIVVVSFVLANIGYYAVLPMEIVTSTTTIALDFGSAVIGSVGGFLYALCVAASCFGVTNASTYTIARLIYVAGTERHLPSMFGELHQKYSTPVRALLLHGVLTTIMIIIGDISGLLLFNGIFEWSWYLITVLGVIVLRIREPKLARPYKVFIVAPVIFCFAAFFVVLRGIISSPIQALFIVMFVLVTVPAYYILIAGWRGFPELRFWKFGKSRERPRRGQYILARVEEENITDHGRNEQQQ